MCVLSLVLGACSSDPVVLAPPTGALPGGVAVTDVAVAAGLQHGGLGQLARGRTALIGDLDGDGWQDVYVGNPNEPSYVAYNRSEPGALRFEPGPVLSRDVLAWGGGLADLDNDGDNDLLVTGGGNEMPARTHLYSNVGGTLTDVTAGTGVGDLRLPGGGPREAAQAHAVVADFDNDGLLDLFVNVNRIPRITTPNLKTNILWRGLPGGAYVDVTARAGLDSAEDSQNSVALDYDQDGDLDLYENTYASNAHVWRNLLVETGELRFEDVTAEVSLGGGDLRYPRNGFVATAADFNLDGWEDVLVFVRAFEPADSPYPDGHVLLLNVEGAGFVDVAPHTGVNRPFVNWEEEPLRDHMGGGVMGATVGDVNADGIPDVYVGQGGPTAGTTDIFFLSTGLAPIQLGERTVQVPQYEDASALVDFPAPEDRAVSFEYPPYPYRTHAVNLVDLDRDGVLEVLAQNGGPVRGPDAVREPARLFRFDFDVQRRWLAFQLRGNGTTVNRSAIGARVEVKVARIGDGAEWTLTQWLHGGNGFASNNGQELYFGLGDADLVAAVTVGWPDGSVTEVDPVPAPGRTVWVDQASGTLGEVD